MVTSLHGTVGVAGLVIRAAHDGDVEAMGRFLAGLSAPSAYRRFLGVLPTSERLLSWLVRAGRNRHALVAARDGEIVAHGMIASLPGGVPELAVVVADHWQQRGVGTRLVAGLLDEARRCGVTEVGFSILADNRPALRLAAQAWPGARPVVDHGVYEFRVPLAARDAA